MHILDDGETWMDFRRIIADFTFLLSLASLMMVSVTEAETESQTCRYAVVISDAAYNESGWKTVADSLVKKHSRNGSSKLFTWRSGVVDVKSSLAEYKPDYVAFITRPVTECNSSFIVTVHRLCRALDTDPYGDAVWGIITGAKAEDALRAISESLTVKTVLSASGNLSYEPPIQRFYQAVGMTCDSYTRTDYLFSGDKGSVYSENKRPENEQDRIKLVSKWLNAESVNLSVEGHGTVNGPVDCIITGGHGNVNLWQCHYPEAGTEGYMKSLGGKLMGAPYSGNTIEINAKTPKIYWCASNCLMGNPDKKDNIVYGAFGSGHAVQMFGFVNEASAGDEFMAWGVYDRITKRAGKLTLPQGYFLSNNNALFEIRNPGKQITTRLVEMFMDSTAFYGDPAGDVHFYSFGDSAHAFKTDIKMSNGSNGMTEFTYTYTMLAHDLEYGEGYSYQFRPAELLPVRIDPSTVEITGNDGNKCEITDNLLIWQMLTTGEKLNKGKSKTLSWRAKITDMKTGISENILPANKNTVPSVLFDKSGRAAQSVLVCNLSSGKYSFCITDISGKVYYKKEIESSGNGVIDVSMRVVMVPGVYCVSIWKKNGEYFNSKIFLRKC
jgi:hypothetical protein